MAETTFVVKLPKLGMQSDEAEILDWLVEPGQEVAEGAELCAIATDKVDTAINSPVAGRVEAILVEPGQTVGVGDGLCVIAIGQSE